MIGAGIAFALAAAVANAFAVVLQAEEARHSPKCQTARFSLLLSLARRPRWLAGTALLILVWPLQVVALVFAPITTVQPILALSELVLLVLAKLKLREQVGRIETLGICSIVAGVVAVVLASPHHKVLHPAAGRVAVPLAVIGAAALLAFALGRRRGFGGLTLVLGAGLGYAWSDFANKLVSNELSSGDLALAAAWLLATLAFGAVAFLQENSALQERPAVTVAPVVASIQTPMPVLMALAAGVERWSPAPQNVAALIGGLLLAAAGAAGLGRSRAVARITAPDPAGRSTPAQVRRSSPQSAAG